MVQQITDPEEKKEYEEELAYAVDLYGADTISKPFGAAHKIVGALKGSPGKIVEGAIKATTDPRVGKINKGLQDWNNRLNAAGSEKGGSMFGGEMFGGNTSQEPVCGTPRKKDSGPVTIIINNRGDVRKKDDGIDDGNDRL